MDIKSNNTKATRPISDQPKNTFKAPNQSAGTSAQHQLKLPKIKDSLQFASKPNDQLASKVLEAGNPSDRTAQEDRRRNWRNSLTVLTNNEKKATEPNKQQTADRQPQQAGCAARTGNVLKESVELAPSRRSTSLSRAGFAPEKATRSPHENSPLTPNFVMGNNNRTKDEKSDLSVTVDQVTTQRPLGPKKSEDCSHHRQRPAEEDTREVSPNAQFLHPTLLTTKSRENSAHVSGSLKQLETYTNQRTDVLTNSQHHKICNSQIAQTFHKSSSQNSLLINKAHNQFKMLNQDPYDLVRDDADTDAQREKAGTRGKHASSKYQKLPPRKGKYNEPYHDGLYRFQDAQLVIPKVANSNISKANPDGGKMPKIEQYGNSRLVQKQVSQRAEDADRAVTRHTQNSSTPRTHTGGDVEGAPDHSARGQFESGQILDGSNENGVAPSQPKNIITGESCQIKQNQEDTENLRRQGAKSSCSQDSDQESEAQYYLLGLNGGKTYISPEQFQKMRQLNPSLQFADEEGGVLPSAPDDANVGMLGTEQEDFPKEEKVMSNEIGRQKLSKPAEVAPTQLKPGEFQNNDGSGSQMGRWTREEHLKFVKALQLFGKDWQSVQKYIVTRSSAQIRSHAQKFFNQIKRKGGQVLIRDNKQRQSRSKKKIGLILNNQTQNTEVFQSCVIANSTMQDESQLSQVGTFFGGDQKPHAKDNSATSLDGRDMHDAPLDNHGNVLFAVQRCLSRHEIDKAKEEILYDEHLNPKAAVTPQTHDGAQQEPPFVDREIYKDANGLQSQIPFPQIKISDIDHPMDEASRKQESCELRYLEAQHGPGGQAALEQEQMQPQVDACASELIQEQQPKDAQQHMQRADEARRQQELANQQNKQLDCSQQVKQSNNQDQKQAMLPMSHGVQTRRERRILEAAQLRKQVDTEASMQQPISIMKIGSEDVKLKKGIQIERAPQISFNSKKIQKSHNQEYNISTFNGQSRRNEQLQLARKVGVDDNHSHESRKRQLTQKKVLLNRRTAQEKSGRGNNNLVPNADDEKLENVARKSSSESEIIKFYRNNSRIKDERFANKLILKYNILTLNKKRIVEQIQSYPEMGERFTSYLGNIDTHVESIQKQLPNPLSSEPDAARNFINNSGDSLQVFLEIFDNFLLIEGQIMQQKVSATDILNNLVLLHEMKESLLSLEDISRKLQELCGEVQGLNDTIKEFASQQNKEENKEAIIEEKPQIITQCDILNDGGSGIIQCTCILHLELLLTDEFFTRLIAQIKEFIEQLYQQLVQMNPDIEQMNLDSDENVQVLNELKMQHNNQSLIEQEQQQQQLLQNNPSLLLTEDQNENMAQWINIPQDVVMFPTLQHQQQPIPQSISQMGQVSRPSAEQAAAANQRTQQAAVEGYGKLTPSVKSINIRHKNKNVNQQF